MRDTGEIMAAFPRPGRAMKGVLATVGIFAVVGAIVVNWAPGGAAGFELFRLLAFEPTDLAGLARRPWTIVTSGVLTSFEGFSHALWALVGLYFLTPDLERRWGGARLIRFLLFSVIIGNLAAVAGTFIPVAKGVFHPPMVFGPMAAITAVVVAWSRENAGRQIRLMFVLPMSGRTLFWLTVGLAVLAIVFVQGTPEGALAPLGGVASGLLFAGSPSPVRSVWLRLRLGALRRQKRGLTVEDLLEGSTRPARPRSPAKRGKAPPLRVVQGGLEEDLKNRKPPKDKRYLN